MIHAIGSSLATFRTLNFGPGLNVLLADQSSVSTDTDSRNSLGKSSFVEIVHFLLGSSPSREKKSLFKASALKRAAFWGEFTFYGTRFRVERRVWDRDKVYVTFKSEPRFRPAMEGDLLEPYVTLDEGPRGSDRHVSTSP